VYREGEYELEDNPTLHTLIQNADGLLGDAYMDRGIIFRTKPDYTVKTIPFNVRELINNPDEHDVKLVKDDIVKITSIFELRQEYSVAISGQVNDGGSFPYFDDMTIKDLIYQAGGFTEQAALYNIEVARRIKDDGSGKIKNDLAEIFNLQITDSLSLVNKGDEFHLKPFDQVFVRKSPTYETQRTVTITGQVLFPGTYVIENRNFKISDLVEKAGGLTEFAYPQGSSLTRNFSNLESSPNYGEQTLSQVGIQLENILRNPGTDQNLLLVEGDRLNIPIRMQTVNVQGEVLFPINVRFDGGKSFKSYLNSAGGVSDEGNRNKAYIIYANGEVDRVKKFLFFKKYPDVRPGSAIYVPPKPEKTQISTSERIAIMSTIVSMAAIVTNTIFQIRRN
jgi:protein involved in polysaccharide export with SLBB domain